MSEPYDWVTCLCVSPRSAHFPSCTGESVRQVRQLPPCPALGSRSWHPTRDGVPGLQGHKVNPPVHHLVGCSPFPATLLAFPLWVAEKCPVRLFSVEFYTRFSVSSDVSCGKVSNLNRMRLFICIVICPTRALYKLSQFKTVFLSFFLSFKVYIEILVGKVWLIYNNISYVI